MYQQRENTQGGPRGRGGCDLLCWEELLEQKEDEARETITNQAGNGEIKGSGRV